MPKKKTFSQKEKERDRQSFEQTPIRSLAVFLQCFDEHGNQVRDVPRFVLEFLASRIQTFFRGRHRSLDAAFGGKVKRQLIAIETRDRDAEVLFDFFGAIEEAQAIPRKQRAGYTPFEIAVEKTATKYNMSKDNVRKIYKRCKS